MKYCDKCSKEFDDGMKFCPLCGNMLTAKNNNCSNCGKEIVGDFKFCPYCGTEVVNNMKQEASVTVDDKVEQETDVTVDKKEEAEAEVIVDGKAEQETSVAVIDDDIELDSNMGIVGDKIVFKIGTEVLKYDKEVNIIHALRVQGLEAALKAEELYAAKLEEYGGVVGFVREDGEYFGVYMVKELLKALVEGLIKEGGYYSLNYKTILDENRQFLFHDWEVLCREIKEQNQEIDDWVQSEKDRRKFRKETRGRLVGGGFGLKGAAVGIAKAGAVNLTTGAAHSLFNMVGNMMTSNDASNMKRKLYDDAKVKLVEEIKSIVLCLSAIIEPYISRTDYNSSSIEDMNEKIERNLIAQPDIIPILIANLRKNPFVSSTYKLLLKNMSENAFDIVAMARIFKVSDKAGRYSLGNYDFIIEFEKEHTVCGKVIVDKKEYEQLIELKKTLSVGIVGKYHKCEIGEFLNRKFVFDYEKIEETLKDNVAKCVETYYINIEKHIDEIIEYIKVEIQNDDKFSLTKWYTDKIISDFVSLKTLVKKYHDETNKLIEFNNKRKACIDNVDAEGFFKLDPRDKSAYELGKMYLEGNGVEKNINIALAYFIKGANANCANCEYTLGTLYAGNVFTDYGKLKYWMKQADIHKNSIAHSYLSQESNYFAKIPNINLLEALSGKEMENEFIKYITLPIINEFLKDYDNKKKDYVIHKNLKGFFEIDPSNVDKYVMGVKYEEGTEVPVNGDIAVAYYLKGSLEDNDNRCQYRIATLYGKTAASTSDVEKLKYWMLKAMENGNNDAKEYLESNAAYFSQIRTISTDEALNGFPADYIFTGFILLTYKRNKSGNLISDKNNDSLFDELFHQITADSDLKGSYYLKNHMDKYKAENAISEYGKRCNLTVADIIMQFDRTFFGTGSEGFIVSADGFLSHEYGAIIKFKDMEYMLRFDSALYVKLLAKDEIIKVIDCENKSCARFALYSLSKILGGVLCYDGKETYKNIMKLSFI
ncbi:zinc-ribbon domain-containing protein [Phascolarctobacterium sp. ET69]|uniref:double zinc ribbon domain-containing protein n=1 Tax=Phascolarctobacterium sp. ET69 TaxID=2939420 RepID=UPI002013956C|nr:zinc ribbon domain-containing protein [Phascolarctobacterium sp. ET69]MCL1605290.1 zinc-ribbon domain-containing protein [Phascolarctobacterium sp. ET69]